MSEQYTWIRFSLLLIVVVFVVGSGFVASTSSDPAPATASAQSQAQATVELDNSSNTTATTITVSQASLPEGGFVAIHDEAYTSGVVHGSEITVSEYLDAGSHENVQIPVNRSIPGGNNISQLNATQANLTAVVYRDTNDNQQFDFEKSFGETDEAYQENETATVSDTEFLRFSDNEQIAQQNSQSAPASLQFNNQELRQTSSGQRLTLSRVTVSEGGFIAVHNQQYLPPTNNPLSSTVGLSRYLEAGTHRNVTIRVSDGAINRTQTVVAIPYMDTNGNQQFDYVKSGGETDYAYLSQQSGTATIVNQTAQVQAPRPARSQTLNPTSTRSVSTATPVNSDQGAIAMEAERDTAAVSPTATNAGGEVQSDGGGIFGGVSWYVVIGGAVILVAVVVIWGFERRS